MRTADPESSTSLPIQPDASSLWNLAPAHNDEDPRRAIRDEDIECRICRKSFRQLTNTHLRTHELTTIAYKQRFGYNAGRALMCRALRRLYAARAADQGLAKRIRRNPLLTQPELRRRGGLRKIALEEYLTRDERPVKHRYARTAASSTEGAQ